MSDELIRQRLEEAADAAAALAREDLVAGIAAAGAALAGCYRAGGKTIWLGNGGSAAQAAHLAAELVGRYLRDRPPLPALSLLDNASAVTALGNDYGYESSFARQVEAHAQPGDVVIGLTTSGTSPNVIAALRAARERGATTIGLGGGTGGELGGVSDHLLLVAADDTPRIQEGHLVIGHTLCELVERALFPE
jgi:D-sedoheptulose 7-phosphate isomerase